MRKTDLKSGWLVVGNDGRRLGTIAEVGQQYLLVETGRLSDNLHVPASAIGNVEREAVHLNVSLSEAEAMGWEQPPRDEDLVDDPESDLHRHV
jgi:hypothetical protein